MSKFVPVSREVSCGQGVAAPGGVWVCRWKCIHTFVGPRIRQSSGFHADCLSRESGGYVPVALLSPVQNRNFFVGPNGQWLGAYIPAKLRAYPFGLLRAQGTDNLTLFIDQDSGLIVEGAEADSEKFFDPDGNPATAIKAVFEFLQKNEAAQAHTDLAVAALAEGGV